MEPVSSQDLSRAVRRTWSVCLARIGRRLVCDVRYRRFLRDPTRADRIFLLTLLRILTAYRLGAMQYGLVTARRPA